MMGHQPTSRLAFGRFFPHFEHREGRVVDYDELRSSQTLGSEVIFLLILDSPSILVDGPQPGIHIVILLQ